MCLGLYLTTNQHHPVYCTGVVYVYGLASHMFLSTDLVFQLLPCGKVCVHLYVVVCYHMMCKGGFDKHLHQDHTPH